MRIFLAVLFILHGFAHAVGFAVPWRLIDADDLSYGTTLLAGHLDVGHAGVRAVGVAWLLIGLAFVVTGIATWLSQGWWPAAATWVAIASLALSIFGWPQARIGVVLNVVILFLLLAGSRLGWLEV